MESCRGLAFAPQPRYRAPGNVWLTEDFTAKIGEFGLGVALDRSRLTQEGMMVGNLTSTLQHSRVGRPSDS